MCKQLCSSLLPFKSSSLFFSSSPHPLVPRPPHSRLPLKTSHMLHELALCFATAACSSLPVLRPTPVAVCGSLSRSLHAVAGSSLRTSRFLLKTGTQCRREHDASRARNLMESRIGGRSPAWAQAARQHPRFAAEAQSSHRADELLEAGALVQADRSVTHARIRRSESPGRFGRSVSGVRMCRLRPGTNATKCHSQVDHLDLLRRRTLEHSRFTLGAVAPVFLVQVPARTHEIGVRISSCGVAWCTGGREPGTTAPDRPTGVRAHIASHSGTTLALDPPGAAHATQFRRTRLAQEAAPTHWHFVKHQCTR
ncbi:hypothetical protein FA95DRAFT_682460 [Auriscalpium vulgare]|uniref:Uncharacterized protein n=1 Tax=Auriscalpium vulgare TaxID=40419 RepID=A0ACB8S1R0_9AGAM|nr:hypothetical protein FA95DRAFT_682460 [Auriscalpium vulgare]